MTEQEYAIRDAEEIHAENQYFEARVMIDCPKNRRIFEAGFNRGWDKKIPAPSTQEG